MGITEVEDEPDFDGRDEKICSHSTRLGVAQSCIQRSFGFIEPGAAIYLAP
jgi:hypothetical protein